MYSVSPHRLRKSDGPKPIEKRGAYTPTAFAARKCRARARRSRAQRREWVIVSLTSKSIPHVATSRRVRGDDRVARFSVLQPKFVQRRFNSARDIRESDAPLEKEGDSLFVRSVENCRCGTPRTSRRHTQR